MSQELPVPVRADAVLRTFLFAFSGAQTMERLRLGSISNVVWICLLTAVCGASVLARDASGQSVEAERLSADVVVAEGARTFGHASTVERVEGGSRRLWAYGWVGAVFVFGIVAGLLLKSVFESYGRRRRNGDRARTIDEQDEDELYRQLVGSHWSDRIYSLMPRRSGHRRRIRQDDDPWSMCRRSWHAKLADDVVYGFLLVCEQVFRPFRAVGRRWSWMMDDYLEQLRASISAARQRSAGSHDRVSPDFPFMRIEADEYHRPGASSSTSPLDHHLSGPFTSAAEADRTPIARSSSDRLTARPSD
ncbi:MAG: hypothetical protein R3C28_23255 [Pirellulaceae bacterium]